MERPLPTIAAPPLPRAHVPAKPIAGAALILLGSTLVAATTVLAKGLGSSFWGDPLHPTQITQGRFVFALLSVSALGLLLRPRMTRPAYTVHLARATFGFLGVTFLFTAVTMIPLSDATAISFLSPIVIMVLAAVFLRERVGPARWVAAGIALCGATILLRPGAEAVAVGALFALAAALCMGLEMTIVKRLAGREGWFQILLVANMIGTCLSSATALAFWRVPTGDQWLALGALGVLMFCAQVCYVRAMALADASFVAPVAYTTLIFAATYDILIFEVWPDAVSLGGAGLILLGALVLTTRGRG